MAGSRYEANNLHISEFPRNLCGQRTCARDAAVEDHCIRSELKTSNYRPRSTNGLSRTGQNAAFGQLLREREHKIDIANQHEDHWRRHRWQAEQFLGREPDPFVTVRIHTRTAYIELSMRTGLQFCNWAERPGVSVDQNPAGSITKVVFRGL